MKRLLALLLVVVMLFAVLALASCGDDNVETTPEATTTEATTTEATTTEATTTEATTTEATTTEATTTEATTTEATTTQPTTPPTQPPVTDPTTATTITEGTTVGVFARFDFGTATKAEAEGKTSHEYLMSILTYNKNCLNVSFTEDTVVIYAIRDYADGLAFSLNFDDIITYDFDDELLMGWGAWNNQPFNNNSVGTKWSGYNQYCKIRIKNPTTNNMWGFQWFIPGGAFYTTQVASNLYLQGGAPTTKTDHKTTANPSDEWKTYTYDVCFLAGLGSGRPDGPRTYVDYVEWANNGNGMANNWVWQNGNKVAAIRFHFLGALFSFNSNATQVAACDSRKNIKQGNHVEVDYVVFGASPAQLAGYTSYLEDAGTK